MMKFFSPAVTLILIALLGACATTRVDMIAEGAVQVMLERSDEVTFNKVDVHEHNSQTEIQVVVQPREHERIFVPGNLKMILILPDGREQQVVPGEARVDHHTTTSRKLQHAHFLLFLPYTLREGSTIKIVYTP